MQANGAADSGGHSARRFGLVYAVRSSLWLVPVLCIVGGIAFALATIAIDRSRDYTLIPQRVTGSATDVQTILSTVASAMVSLSSIVLTVTLVAVQLAMGQFSPRIVRALLEDRRNQLAIGLFFTTFVFAVLGVREVDDRAGTVPGLTVVTCYALTLLSLVGLVLFVHHASQMLRVSGLVDLVGDETRAQVERRYPGSSPAYGDEIIMPGDPGVIMHLDRAGLVALAREADCVLQLLPALGDFVPTGAPLFRVAGSAASLDGAKAVRMVAIGPERTHHGEPSYGLRKLVDMAERAIAQPFNDPTTAVQVIHRLHDCLRLLAARPFPSGDYRDADGTVRLITRTLDWDGYVRLAFDELCLAGATVPSVTRRLMAALISRPSPQPSATPRSIARSTVWRARSSTPSTILAMWRARSPPTSRGSAQATT